VWTVKTILLKKAEFAFPFLRAYTAKEQIRTISIQKEDTDMAVEQFLVPDVSCQHCVKAITNEVSTLKGVQQVVVNLSNKSVRVEHDGSVSVNSLMDAIKEAGFDEISALA
jgi:copper chaperone